MTKLKKGFVLSLGLWTIMAAACIYVTFKALDYRRHVNYFLDKYTSVVSEFSGRAKYAEANKPLAASETKPDRIVFLGDQIFESWKLDSDFPPYEAINRGVTGQWLSGFLLRLRPDVLELRLEPLSFSSARTISGRREVSRRSRIISPIWPDCAAATMSSRS